VGKNRFTRRNKSNTWEAISSLSREN